MAASSSAAAAAAAADDVMTQITDMEELRKANKQWLVNQLELRGFGGKKVTEIKRMSKQEVLDFVEKLIDTKKWT